MRPIATHVAWSVGHNREPYTKTAELVNRARCRKVWARVRPTSHVLLVKILCILFWFIVFYIM